MDKSNKVSGADGGVWSCSCPILNATTTNTVHQLTGLQSTTEIPDTINSGGSSISRWRGAPTSDAGAFRWKRLRKRKNWVPLGEAPPRFAND